MSVIPVQTCSLRPDLPSHVTRDHTSDWTAAAE
jgi:hypothetical protein